MFDKADVKTPLARAPPKAPTPASLTKEGWWAETPSRQSTDGSTTASENGGAPSAASPDPAAYEARERRLACVKEQRGWKHFFRHVVGVPLAFAGGVSFGAALVVALAGGSPHGAGGPATAAPRWPLAPAKVPYAAVAPPTEVPAEYLSAEPLNNSCLLQNLVIPDGPQTFDACAFVIRSTDEVWNLRGNVEEALEKYFHEGYINAGSWGRRGVGKQALREAVLSEMRAFPDIKIHITDCVCKGNDNDGYKCGMPDVLTGTNLGPSAYGPPTGKFARWTGLIESLVKKNPATGQWQYYAEWGVHDEWALIQQLGLDFARVPHPPRNAEPIHDCTPLFKFAPQPQVNSDDLLIQKEAQQRRPLV